MSGRTITHYVLVCDGCGKEIGNAAEFESHIEARAAAWAQGWRMPPRVKLGGGPGRSTSDVCPDCLPDWEPQSAPDAWKYRRAAR